MTLAGGYGYQSGRPWGREIRFGRARPGATRVLYAPFNDDRRVDALNQLDFRLEKALSFAHGIEGAVFGDLLNVSTTTRQRAARPPSLRRRTSAVPSTFVLPRRLMIGAKFRF